MSEPLVTVLTPVYNGEKYLAECIESVMKQDYANWEYVIVNNCSTDGTREIAERYAMMDRRIRVYNCQEFVGVIENHNRAFSLISADSKYCKVVSADDFIMPECLTRMIEVATAHPTIGIVGSYQLRGEDVKWKGLPLHTSFMSGREACRLTVLQNMQFFGNPTSELYSSDMVRQNTPFFFHSLPYADISACFRYLQKWDFGFVHEILSQERIHKQQISTEVRKISMDNFACMEHLIKYGKLFLSEEEYENEKRRRIALYNRWLGGCLLKLKGIDFWRYQKNSFKTLGIPIEWSKVLKGALDEIEEEIQNPKTAFKKVISAVRLRFE